MIGAKNEVKLCALVSVFFHDAHDSAFVPKKIIHERQFQVQIINSFDAVDYSGIGRWLTLVFREPLEVFDTAPRFLARR